MRPVNEFLCILFFNRLGFDKQRRTVSVKHHAAKFGLLDRM